MTEIDWAHCGTEANYAQHRRRNEKPCKACIRAATRARIDRKRRQRRNRCAVLAAAAVVALTGCAHHPAPPPASDTLPGMFTPATSNQPVQCTQTVTRQWVCSDGDNHIPVLR